MSWQYAIVEREGPLTIVTINRPEVHNALGDDANREMAAIFDEFATDDEQWVAIITGAGEKAFCAGLDLKQQAGGAELKPPPMGFGGLTSRFDLTKPVIAAVNGVAMGGGCEIALACDIVVASAKARFALPEARVGLAALGGGLLRLPQQIGLRHAMGMLLTGRIVGADEALRLGLVNEVTDGDVVALARQWAAQILRCSPLSVRASKEAAMRSFDLPLADADAAQWEFPAMAAMLASEDRVEGPAAFAEKREPAWKGR